MIKEKTPEEYLKHALTPEDGRACPVRKALELLDGKWKTYVIYELCKRPSCRFGELKKALSPITNTMLTSTLRDLNSLGIISRRQFNEIPPHVEYALTEKGRALLPVFFELAKWGDAYLTQE